MTNKIFSVEKLEDKNRYLIYFLGLKIKIKMSLSYLIQKQLLKLLKPLIKLLDIIIPKDKNKVIFTSYPDFSDSAKIFYDYLKSIKQDKFKKICWIYTENDSENREISDKKYYLFTFSAIYQLLTSKYIVHDHCDKFISFLLSDKRVLFNLWHGMPIKAIGQLDTGLARHTKRNYKYLAKNSYMFIISDIYRVIMSSMLNINPNKIFVTGQARTDVMFRPTEGTAEKLGLDTSKKLVIYTPTYKKRSKNEDVKTEYDNIFYLKDYSDNDFLSFLEQNNLCLVIKPHPFEESDFKNRLKNSPLVNNNNVKILYSEDFVRNNLMLNEIFPLSSLIISDFSSVTIDYAMLKKPILYLNNYTEEYKNGRGLILPDNYKILMPGEDVNTYEELKNKILNCIREEKPNYKQEEVALLHKYIDGNSCERIFDTIKNI